MNNNSSTITLDCLLPSMGLIYEKEIDPHIKLRSMTTLDEMKRLSKSDNQYQNMAELIDNCNLSDTGLSAYDMCLSDYKYLIYKLREVTYGSIYKLAAMCPYCGSQTVEEIDLSAINSIEYTDELDQYRNLTLSNGDKLLLNYQTPRMLDKVAEHIRLNNKRGKNTTLNTTLLYSIYYLINKKNNERIEAVEKEEWIKNLPMADTNLILTSSDKFVNGFGLDLNIEYECDVCGATSPLEVKITSEFFRPAL